MAIDYQAWMKVRNAAKERELNERGKNLDVARPPLQVSINDQVIREILERLDKVESLLERSTSKRG